MKTLPVALVLLVAAVLAGCGSPKMFVRSTEPAWAIVQVRPDIKYDAAWEGVVDSLVKRFDIETMSRPDGYIRTAWLYTWTGKLTEDYRVRVTAKFTQDHGKVELKSDAEYGGPGRWVSGYDKRLLDVVRTDITTSVGR